MSVAYDLESNPIINPPKLRHDAPALDLVRTAHFLPAIEYGIARMKTELEAIKNIPASFQNTIEGLEFAGGDLGRASGIFYTFSGTKSNKTIEKLDGVIGQKLADHYNNLFLDDALFAKVKAVHDDPQSQNLGAEEAMLLTKTYKSFVRAGALLDPQQKARLREIDSRMAELSAQYSNNAKGSKADYKKIVDLADLDGVPDRVLNKLKDAAEKENLPGKAIIRLNSLTPDVVAYAKNRALREELSKASRNVAYADPKFDNRPVVMETVALRHERAQLFGYKNHAEFVLSDRMAKTPEAVNAFLERNLKTYKPAAEEHLQKIRDFAMKKDGLGDLQSWDLAYYERQLTEETFGLDMEALRPYFSLDKVIEGFHKHAEKAFGVEFREAKYPVQSKNVKVYEIFNKASNSFVALFYANYYENTKNKRGGAWMNGLRDGGIRNGQTVHPIVTNDCNYQKPTSKKVPTLVTLSEDTTIRHEGGHGFHGMLSKAKYPSLGGTNVKWDWVEVPSQLQENWASKKEVLNEYALHYQDNTPIPEELLQKLLDMQTFGAGMAGLRQTYLAMLDMKWHTTDPATIRSVEELEDSVGAVATLLPRVGGTTSTSFTHIFSGGYDSGYYSYKWAEVIEADIFNLFEQNGLYHQPTLDRVRELVYESGGTRDPDDLFRDLMGRDPDPAALFKREGLAGPARVAPASPPPAPKP